MGSEIADDLPTQHVDASPADMLEEQRALNAIKHSLFKHAFRPLTLSRYVLTERLGAGGAGIVYRAFDPELRRQVAIKVVRTGTRSEGARERLRREAQAIAQLAHPNVVAIYDVGAVVPGDTGGVFGPAVYLVMELVEGKTLRAWLGEEGHDWQEVLDVFLGAARGLEAAHAAGIVHRDFKPANVLLGRDGRVRVLDFGLATAVGAVADSSGGGLEVPVDPSTSDDSTFIDDTFAPLTREGAVMGTPPYMAPEQHAGQRADARADQYAWCAALWEGLAGIRPFMAETTDQLAATKRAGPPAPPAKSAAPKWLFVLIAQGLAPRPEHRWSSVRALVQAIETRRRRKWRVLTGAGALMLAGVVGTSLALASRPPPDACGAIDADDVWSASQRSQTRASFGASSVPWAPASWAQVERGLTEFAESWADARADLCRGLAAGDISAEEFTRRDACLERQRDRFDSTARLLAVADADMVTNAGLSVAKLPKVSECSEISTLSPRPQIDDAEVRKIDRLLQDASAQFDLGRYQPARQLSLDALLLAERAGDHLGEARACRQLTTVANNSGRGKEGDMWARRGLLAAEAAGDERQAVRHLLAVSAGAPDSTTATLWLDLAERRIGRLDPEGADKRLVADLAGARATAARVHRDHVAALAHAERAVETLAEAIGPKALEMVYPLNTLAMSHDELGDLQQALAVNQRAQEVAAAHLGNLHPTVASLLNNRGSILRHHGRDLESIEVLLDTLERKETVHGTEAKRLLTTLLNLAIALSNAGRLEQAGSIADRMQRIADVPPATPDDQMYALSARVHWLRLGERCEEALPTIRKGLELVAADPNLSSRSLIIREWAACAVDLRDEAHAWEATDRALSLDREEYGYFHPKTARALWWRARASAVIGDDRARRADLELAHRICGQYRADGRWCGRVAFDLARDVQAMDPARADRLARLGIDELMLSDTDDRLIDELLGWRAEAQALDALQDPTKTPDE